MRVEIDAAVREYVVRVLASILPGHAAEELDKKNGRFQEQAVMCVLEGMVASGGAEHRYDKTRDVDEFNSTDRPIRNWSWVFPGDQYCIDRSERQILEMRGKRSRYFNKRWLAPDQSNPVPSWPTS